MTGRYEAMVDSLSLQEQATLTAGDDDWHTRDLPDRGIPRLKVTDGPVGARGESYTTTTSALFPCGSALGATFDPELVGRVGAAIADEARTKGAHVLLGPTMNLIRHPLGGRNFEAYSEDPTLTARLAVAFIRGVQGRGVGACAKHFVANDAEIERHSISSDIDERTLREVYLRPFEAAVHEGRVWTVMAAYNRINGTFGCEHHWLLTSVLKEEWGFDGVVMSDWFATHHTVDAALAGLDLEMPGPAHHLGAALADAVAAGAVPRPVVREQASRLLRLADRVGAVPEEPAEQSVDDPDRWALAREASAASMVLLRNEAIDGRALLPLDETALRRVAVIGPNAAAAVVQGGGSARVTPPRTVTPLVALRERLGRGVEVVYEPGARRSRVPVLGGSSVGAGGGADVRMEYRDEAGGDVLFTNTVPTLDAVWSGRFAPGVDPLHFHVRATAMVVPERAGRHELSLTSIGPCQLSVDGVVVADTTGAGQGRSFFGLGTKEVRAGCDLAAGRSYEVVAEYARPPGQPLAGIRVGLQPPLGDDSLERAASAAAGADVAVVVVGTDETEETEGKDRRTMSLGAEQDELVRRVAAANPHTVVVVNAGSAVELPWADAVGAVLVAWFPGMAGGEALARVLVGDDEPAGRLPFTVPASLADAPCDISVASPPGHLHYTEGLLVGHRWYLTRGLVPRWWFGEGTGYTSFEWGPPSTVASWAPGSPLVVSVPITNTGHRAGHDVVQAYVRWPRSAVERPAWTLAGLAKQRVAPGSTAIVEVVLDPGALRHWSPEAGWVTEAGPLEVRIARSAGEPGEVVALEVVEPADG